MPASCPRCGCVLHPPGLMSSDWTCDRHGPVLPYRVLPRVSPEAVRQVSRGSKVPLWSPLPMPPGWAVSGLATAGDDRSGPRATALALSGPSPVGGPADLVLLAEEPGIGLGARLAGLDGPDPGHVPDGQPDAKVEVAGHPTALWRSACAPDRSAFVGEAAGVWLWALLWPADAELVLVEHLVLHDLRAETHAAADLPVGASTSRLAR